MQDVCTSNRRKLKVSKVMGKFGQVRDEWGIKSAENIIFSKVDYGNQRCSIPNVVS
jgi:hypothetical protein